MKREILFRGKRIDDGEWIYGYLADVQEQYGYATINYVFDDGEEYWESCDHVDINTVGQYTGLHDKNGKEIYDGDILTWRSIICEEDGVETWELPVTFYNGCFCLDDDFDMTLISVIYDSEEFGGVKVISNIHEK